MNLGVQMSLWDTNFTSFDHISRSGTTGSFGSSIFNFEGKFYTVFQIASHQQYKWPPFLCIPSKYVIFCLFNSSSNRCEIICHCGFIYIFLMISDIEPLFISLLAICMPSLEKYLFNSFILKSGYVFSCYCAAWINVLRWKLK